MDLASALKPDVFRAFAIYICPGVVAALPWILGVFWPDAQHSTMWKETSFSMIAVLLLAALCVGLILEDIGSRIETHVVDRRLKKQAQYAGISTVFWAYLRTCSSSGLVAHKFLSATVTRYKFELSMIPACLCSALGLEAAYFLGTGLNYPKTVAGIIVLVTAAGILLKEAHDSARLLHTLRELILSGPIGTVAVGAPLGPTP